jgi:pyruvate dehydrogenase E2 component (dihydrolipoyllysine-residue acetyltransferase)
MSVSVSMPQLGESVTEGTVTRWLKKEGERVEVDEPLLEVSTDKVDTEIPSPASGILRSIAVDEDETVEVGAQLAIIEDSETSDSQPEQTSPPAPEHTAPTQDAAATPLGAAESGPAAAEPEPAAASSDGWSAPTSAPPAPTQTPGYAPPPAYGQPPSYGQPAAAAPAPESQPYAQPTAQAPSAPAFPPAQVEAAAETPSSGEPAAADEYPPPTPLPGAGEAPYVTPLVRKLAVEHAVNLETVTGTGVGGRIRKQDVIEAARAQRGSPAPTPQAPQAPQDAAAAAAAVPQQAQQVPGEPPSPAGLLPAAQPPTAPAARRPAEVPSSLRGTTQRMSRPRQVIAQRMVESLRVSAQLTTVVEADVTAIARLRDRAKADFEAREGVKLTFLPFFALAAVEALKMHPKLNAVIDGDQVTYHDTEHLGVAVDTERGLMVPVIHNAGDLNIGGLARKIDDLAQRTRSGQVGPDELAGGTFTLTSTGSRGALFDTPIINQPQVAILGTGTVVRRPVVVKDAALGEVIAVRSMVYLALTYDHRLVDGADAARFLTTVKNRLEEGAFETELGL